MIIRQYTPSPWHDAVTAHYTRLAKLAPNTAIAFVAHRYGLKPSEVLAIVNWCRARKRTQPCQVSA